MGTPGPAGPTGAPGPQGPAGDITGAVRYDQTQVLTAPQALTARQNIFAAPIDSMIENNLIINGSFNVAQQYGSNVVSLGTGNNSVWVLDQWNTVQNSSVMTSAWNKQTSNFPYGYSSGIGGSVGTANPSPAATDYLSHQQKIDGAQIARLQWGSGGARPVTLGFWVAMTVPGTYSVTLRDTVSGQCYPATYTINAANTWEYKTIVIPGCTAGTSWSGGLFIVFTLVCGSNYLGVPNTWQSGNIVAANNTNNFAAVVNNAWITGVSLLPGNDAPASDRAPLLMRSIANEQLMCERWFRYLRGVGFYGYAPTSITGIGGIVFPAMRKAPAVTFANTTYTNGSALALNAASVNAAVVQWTIAGAPSFVSTDILLDARS
jgi:hypothetical protein